MANPLGFVVDVSKVWLNHAVFVVCYCSIWTLLRSDLAT